MKHRVNPMGLRFAALAVVLVACVPTGATVRATGRATYGHYGGHGSWHAPYYPYYPPYPSYGYAPGWAYGWWGWPYAWGYGYYGSPYTGTVRIVGDVGSLPVAVETDVVPKKARLTLDGREAGRAKDFNGTWDLLYLAPGSHTLEFTLEGHKTLRVELHAAGGQAVRIEHVLAPGEGEETRTIGVPAEPIPASRASTVTAQVTPSASEAAARIPSGFLRITVLPRDASIYLDGEFLASADELARLHGALVVAAGRHRIEIVRPGYGPDTREVIVGAGEALSVDVVLELAR